jgi:hypothetical protein
LYSVDFNEEAPKTNNNNGPGAAKKAGDKGAT